MMTMTVTLVLVTSRYGLCSPAFRIIPPARLRMACTPSDILTTPVQEDGAFDTDQGSSGILTAGIMG